MVVYLYVSPVMNWLIVKGVPAFVRWKRKNSFLHKLWQTCINFINNLFYRNFCIGIGKHSTVFNPHVDHCAPMPLLPGACEGTNYCRLETLNDTCNFADHNLATVGHLKCLSLPIFPLLTHQVWRQNVHLPIQTGAKTINDIQFPCWWL